MIFGKRSVFSSAAFITAAFLSACGSSTSNAPANPAATSSTSAGDIPDTANYLTFRRAGFSISYVEGWAIRLNPLGGVAISDKDSSETVSILRSSRNLKSFSSADLAQLASTAPRFRLLSKQTVALPAGSSIYAKYRTLSPPDPVTSKRVTVIVDRYYVSGPAKLATLTLATPLGVDNVDAFKLISRSFRWK